MTSLTRKFSASARGRAALLAAAAVLLPAALLARPEVAAAQVPEPPVITIYHSLDPLGADPRSTSIPPGCAEGVQGGGGSGAIVVVGDVDAGNNPTFYGNVLGSGTQVLAGRGTFYGVSPIIAHYESLPGVSVTVTNTTITSEILANYDLLLFNQTPSWNIPLNYTAAELTAIGEFVANGGTLLLVAEISNPAYYPSANDFLTGIGSSIQYGGRRALIGGPHAVVSGAPFTDGLEGFSASAYNDLTGGEAIVVITTTPPDPFAGAAIVAAELGAGVGPPTVECVLGGGDYEELRLWIDAGAAASDPEKTVCKLDEASGGDGHEICGAALTFQIQGIGRFREAVSAAEPDPGIDTLVLGTECTPGEGLACTFQTIPPVKLITLNFRIGDALPAPGPRFLGSLILDTTGLIPETNYSEISVVGQGAGAKLQLLPINEVIADSRLAIPEPGQLAQLLSGLLGLAGLNRLRRKH